MTLDQSARCGQACVCLVAKPRLCARGHSVPSLQFVPERRLSLCAEEDSNWDSNSPKNESSQQE